MVDPLLVAAAGSAVAAFLLKKKPVSRVPAETFCPPQPPPATSEEWVKYARTANSLIGTGGALAAGLLIPGVGFAVGGIVKLAQSATGLAIDLADRGNLQAQENVRQRLIQSCYGHPPGTAFMKGGAMKRIATTFTLLDLYTHLGKRDLARFFSQSVQLVPRPTSIYDERDVKYFVTTEGPPSCCAQRISPEQAQQMGVKLYTEADARKFWSAVDQRRKFRELKYKMAAGRALSDAKANTAGAVGTGFVGKSPITNIRPPGYEFPSNNPELAATQGRIYVPRDQQRACMAGRVHNLICHATMDEPDIKHKCMWLTSTEPC